MGLRPTEMVLTCSMFSLHMLLQIDCGAEWDGLQALRSSLDDRPSSSGVCGDPSLDPVASSPRRGESRPPDESRREWQQLEMVT